MTAAVVAAGAALATAATAWAGFATEAGSPYATDNAPLSVVAADFDSNGRADVAVVNGTSSTVQVFLRQPGGGFAQEAGSPFAVGSGPGGVAVGDYNADGRPDLAVTNFVDGTVSILLRQPGGGFALEGGAAIAAFGAQAISAGDFNNDGKLDLVVSLYRSNQVMVLLRNTQNTGFTTGFTGATGQQPSSSTAADFNGDGLTDFALVNSASNFVSVRLQLPNGGGFTSETDVPTGIKPSGIVAADFDRDGRPDLAVTDNVSGAVTILLRKATNDGFAEEAGSPIAVSSGPVGITAADFDRDGRTDLAIAANGEAVDVLRRNAGPGFTRDPAIAMAGAPNGIAAADFDGDARPDLAVSAATGNTMSVLLNPAAAQPPPAPTPTPTPQLPPPVAGKTFNVKPVSGKVKIKLPKSSRYVPLTQAAQIPSGASVDTRDGRITITAAQGKGKTASADFFDGLFKLTQTKGSKPVTTLQLTEALNCPKAGKASLAAKKPKTRKLWGDGTGSFRTRGQYSAATVRGTRWLTQDTCTTTLTRVVRGAVSVRDEVKRKTIILRAGKRYTARRKR